MALKRLRSDDSILGNVFLISVSGYRPDGTFASHPQQALTGAGSVQNAA
jgi:hypothetical protein